MPYVTSICKPEIAFKLVAPKTHSTAVSSDNTRTSVIKTDRTDEISSDPGTRETTTGVLGEKRPCCSSTSSGGNYIDAVNMVECYKKPADYHALFVHAHNETASKRYYLPIPVTPPKERSPLIVPGKCLSYPRALCVRQRTRNGWRL